MIDKINETQAVAIEVKEDSIIKYPDAAQYGGSDYANAVRVERGISLQDAMWIALQDPNIDYFFYTKGGQMVLMGGDPNNDPLGLVEYAGQIRFDDGHIGEGYCRIFHHGDVVFFKNEGKWIGSAPGLADLYCKE